MEDLLQRLGLTELQSGAYLYLLEHGESTPPALAKHLRITRTNAYKLLDRLVELNLAQRRDVNKKLAYAAEDPIALTDLLAAERNRMIALEHDIKESLHTFRNKYRAQSDKVGVKSYTGSARIKQMYEQQASIAQPIHFVASRADIPFMGFDTMRRLRHLPKQYGQERYGIVSDSVGGPADPAIDERTNLHRTWMPSEEYTAPVEWSVCGDELALFVFDKSGSVIRITHPVVAEAFRQLWNMLDTHMRADPGYADLPRKASRNV